MGPGDGLIDLGAFVFMPLYGANQLGVAGAALTMNEHADTVATNPAGIMRLQPGTHLSLGVLYGEAQVTWEGRDDRNPKSFASETTKIPSITIPTFQMGWRLPEKRWGFGIALKFPFNINNAWDRDWPGREVFTRLELRTATINPNVALALNDNNSLAVGINYTHSSLLLVSRIPLETGNATIDLKGSGSHLNLAYLGNKNSWFYAVHYNSPLTLHYNKGTVDFATHTNALFNDPQSALALRDSDATSELNLPWILELALGWKSHPVHPQWEVEIDSYRMGWSAFKQLKIEFDQRSPGLMARAPFKDDQILIPTHYFDANNYRVGAAYHWEDRAVIRFGIDRGQRVTPAKYTNPAIPLGDMLNFAWGAEFKLDNQQSWSLQQSYTFLQRVTAEKTLSTTNSGTTPFGGSYEGHILIASLSYYSSF